MDSNKNTKDENNMLIKGSQENVLDETNFRNFESQFNFSPQTENLLKASVPEQALENIKHIFNKTETIRKVADVKHNEIQAQFKELRQRLNNSSECLNRMKKGIDNIKFSYQNKILDMHRTLTPPGDNDQNKGPPQTKEEVAKQIEEIQGKIEKIQSQVHMGKQKQEKVMHSYKDAFENVTSILESIDKGEYSSVNSPNEKAK